MITTYTRHKVRHLNFECLRQSIARTVFAPRYSQRTQQLTLRSASELCTKPDCASMWGTISDELAGTYNEAAVHYLTNDNAPHALMQYALLDKVRLKAHKADQQLPDVAKRDFTEIARQQAARAHNDNGVPWDLTKFTEEQILNHCCFTRETRSFLDQIRSSRETADVFVTYARQWYSQNLWMSFWLSGPNWNSPAQMRCTQEMFAMLHGFHPYARAGSTSLEVALTLVGGWSMVWNPRPSYVIANEVRIEPHGDLGKTLVALGSRCVTNRKGPRSGDTPDVLSSSEEAARIRQSALLLCA